MCVRSLFCLLGSCQWVPFIIVSEARMFAHLFPAGDSNLNPVLVYSRCRCYNFVFLSPSVCIVSLSLVTVFRKAHLHCLRPMRSLRAYGPGPSCLIHPGAFVSAPTTPSYQVSSLLARLPADGLHSDPLGMRFVPLMTHPLAANYAIF